VKILPLILQGFIALAVLLLFWVNRNHQGSENFLSVVVLILIFAASFLTAKLSWHPRSTPTQTPHRAGTFEREDQEMALSEKQRMDFVTSVSHELRTPLTAIQGYTDLVSTNLTEEQRAPVQSYLEIIEKNTGRLIDLCSDLLKMGRIEHNDIERVTCSPQAITQEVMDRLNDQILQKAHEISVRIEIAEIRADERLLGQVVNNLVENAIRYCPSHGKIEVSWEKSKSGVLLAVKDDGPGIRVEHHERLFDRFYRVDKSRSRDEGGTGLGLALVKQISLKHNGRVWVESRAGEGATFYCYFPRS
jgi:two-component system phosphate regulon sensor histidine kinase PhoR